MYKKPVKCESENEKCTIYSKWKIILVRFLGFHNWFFVMNISFWYFINWFILLDFSKHWFRTKLHRILINIINAKFVCLFICQNTATDLRHFLHRQSWRVWKWHFISFGINTYHKARRKVFIIWNLRSRILSYYTLATPQDINALSVTQSLHFLYLLLYKRVKCIQ